ncbi:hypothetical protein [Clostridium vincentii]|uniref:hypothetical protein n=1 Tax=Clostridium vincentii TaxID=52704 RepID=UPI0011B21529|nr:hypothetical protein [Clostridium vincentii]
MIISKDNGKKLFELNENELIIYRFLRNKIIKRRDIRSAYLNEQGLIILTYDNKTVTKSIINMSWNDREGLKILVDEINNENVVFGTTNKETPLWYVFIYPIYLLAQLTHNKFIFILTIIAWIILMAITIVTLKSYKGNMYYIDTERFEVIGFRNRIKRRFTTSDIELVKSDEVGTKYKVKDSRYKFYIRNVITYPVLYKKAIAEMKMKAE